MSTTAEAGSFRVSVPVGNFRAFLSHKDSDAIARVPEAPHEASPFAMLEHIAERVPVGSSHSTVGFRARFDDGTNVIAGMRTDHGNHMIGAVISRKLH